METNSDSRPNLDGARQRMVQNQLVARNIQDARVLAAMSDIPREAFVSLEQQDSAYEDYPLPVGYGQTISQPYTVAFMCQAAGLQATDKVLEIGTGSGYGAAVLSRLAAKVYSVERIPELAEAARERLKKLGYGNVQVHVSDGTCGLEAFAPFDAIIVTAGSRELPAPLIEQLAVGGRLVIPVGPLQSQTMLRYTRHQDWLNKEKLGRFAFVPLIGRFGGQPEPHS